MPIASIHCYLKQLYKNKAAKPKIRTASYYFCFMYLFLKHRWPLFLVLLVFIICKIPHLSYSYYWDESWPYAPAIREMYNHGISIMPTAVESELSRGHPLFFHAIAAMWMHIFGNSFIAMHSFALFISLLFLITIYEAGLKIFNKRVAVLALLLVASQELFFVQSSYVLMEILVAFLAFASLYFYVREKYLLTILTLSALFYTKESGLIMGAVLGLDAFFSLLSKEGFSRKNIFRVLSVAAPCLLIGIFFLIQKHIRGWYIFPFYSELIEHSWKAFWYKFRMSCVRYSFYENYKYLDMLLLLILSIVAAIKQKKAGYLILWLPGAIIYYYVDDLRAGRLLPSVPFFIVFVISLWCMLYTFRRIKLYENKEQQKFIELSTCFIFSFLCFSATNFLTYRYLLADIVPLLFFAAFIVTRFSDLSYKWIWYPATAMILFISFYAFYHNPLYGGDTDMAGFKGIKIQKNLADFLEKNNYYDSSICCGSFMEKEHLIDPNTGFLKSQKAFKNVKWELDASTAFIVFDSMEYDYRYKQVISQPNFHLVYRTQEGKLWGEIYQQQK